jgi:hypothetical protein
MMCFDSISSAKVDRNENLSGNEVNEEQKRDSGEAGGAESGAKSAVSRLLMSGTPNSKSMKPVPSEQYVQRQREVCRLYDTTGAAGLIPASSIKSQLEAEFVRAWRFSNDLDGRAHEMKMMAGRNSDGFDHCTWYYEAETGSHVVVTQPYFEPQEVIETLREGLVVEGKVEPELIAAPEWAFYYPGHATLVVVKFSPAYERILEALDRLRLPAARWTLGHN